MALDSELDESFLEKAEMFLFGRAVADRYQIYILVGQSLGMT